MEPASAGFFASAFASAHLRLRAETKKPAKAGFHDAAETGSSPRERAAGFVNLLRCGRLQTLDGCSEAALMASCLVLVNNFLVGNDVQRLCRCLEDFSGLRCVAGFDCLADSLDSRAVLRAQRRVVRVCLGGLTGALACLCGVSHDGSLSCSCFQCPLSYEGRRCF